MGEEITGATYQSEACKGRWRAANSMLFDRRAVCGPMFLSDHLCFSESCTHTHTSAMPPACSPSMFLFSDEAQRPSWAQHATHSTHMALMIQLGHSHVGLCYCHVICRAYPECELNCWHIHTEGHQSEQHNYQVINTNIAHKHGSC